MKIKVSYTTEKQTDAAVSALKSDFSGMETKAVLFFASSAFPPAELASAMEKAFPGVSVFGCTTAGEICSGFMSENSIVAMAMTGGIIADLRVEVLEDVKGNAKGALNKAIDAFHAHFKIPLSEMDFNKYVGLILIDGLSGTEEILMDAVGNVTNINIIGGSAGDDLKFAETFVFAHGKAYSNAAILALVKAAGPFSILKTQSFRILDKTLVATKVNEKNREVIEFNGKSAVEAYAEAVGVPAEKASDAFMRYPIGLVIDGDPYVRSPQRIEGNSIFFYCNILEGMELSLLESTDIVADTQKAVADMKNGMGSVSGIINFHCILRTLELKSKNQVGPYAAIFKDVPTVGFSTYGEELFGHINQTSTMLLFA